MKNMSSLKKVSPAIKSGGPEITKLFPAIFATVDAADQCIGAALKLERGLMIGIPTRQILLLQMLGDYAGRTALFSRSAVRHLSKEMKRLADELPQRWNNKPTSSVDQNGWHTAHGPG